MRNTGREINDSRANEYLIDITSFRINSFVVRVVWVKCSGGVFEYTCLYTACPARALVRIRQTSGGEVGNWKGFLTFHLKHERRRLSFKNYEYP